MKKPDLDSPALNEFGWAYQRKRRGREIFKECGLGVRISAGTASLVLTLEEAEALGAFVAFCRTYGNSR